MSCCIVEAWITGHFMVKFDTEREPVQKALLGRRHCPETARVAAVTSEGFVLLLCPSHAERPICGAVVQPDGPPCEYFCDCGGQCSILYPHDEHSCSGNIPDDCEA